MKKFSYPCGCSFDLDDSGSSKKIIFDASVENINLECDRAWDLISCGNTKGIFQLESRLGRSIAKKLKPENMEQLSALISILQGLGSTGTTAAGALNWARQQTEIMVANIDYYDIVTSGLTFVVDASYAPSYPRSGTTWYDLTRNGNNVSNTPATWASTLGGTISRSNQTNIFSTLIPSATGTSYTMCAFVNVSGTLNGPGSQIFGTTNTLGPSINVSSSPAMSAITFNSVTVTKPGSDFKQWNYFVGVQSGSTQLFYVNGTLSGTTSATNTSFGAFLNFGYIGAKTVSMTMGSFQLYNRALSQTEVTKNWNALRTRFGL